MEWMDLINEDVRDRYEFHNIDHAVEILYQGYPLLFQEINLALHDFYITHDDLVKAGGNESDIPKASLLHLATTGMGRGQYQWRFTRPHRQTKIRKRKKTQK